MGAIISGCSHQNPAALEEARELTESSIKQRATRAP